MENVLKPLVKGVLIPLGLTSATTTDPAIQKNIFGSAGTTSIILNEEINWFIDKRC